MAVMSERPVFLARRNAMNVKTRSPTRTPTAVPGIIRVKTNGRGIWKTIVRRLAIRIMTPMLSSISPKKALISPRRAHS
jgi:hypothetical protein